MTQTSTETADDPGSYHKRISVAASPATVFALLTDPERLRRWQSIVSSVELEVGGEYRHLVVPGAVATGRFLEVHRDRRLVYSWEWAQSPGDPAGASTVTVELQADGDRTIIDFIHAGLPDAEALASHTDGWDHFLDRLGVAAETEDAGPDPWAAGPEDLDLIGVGEASLALILDLLRSASEEDLLRSTPCAEFTMSDLVEHLVGSMASLGAIAGAEPPPADAPDDVESRVAAVGGSALAAWRVRGTEGEVEFGGRAVPASVPFSVVVAELFVHGWDMARAIGQPFAPANQILAGADRATRGVIPADRGDRFAPARPEDGLGPVDALMAFSGRQV